MTKEDLDFIKDAFSQIIDDIGGNPDWYEAARAVASDLGTLERKLEEKVSPLPSNLDEAAEKAGLEYAPKQEGEAIDLNGDVYATDDVEWPSRCGFIQGFKAGAEWMAGQGVNFDTEMSWLDSFGFQIGWPEDTSIFDCFNPGDKVVVQIRKK